MNLIPGSAEGLRFDGLRNDDNAITVGEDNVARRKADAADFHRHVEINHPLAVETRP